MPKSMRRQANGQNIAKEKGLNIAKRRKLAVCLLKERIRSLRHIAHITNIEKSVSRIGSCLRSNEDVSLETMLCPSTYRRGASTVLTSEEEAMLTERVFMQEREELLLGKTH